MHPTHSTLRRLITAVAILAIGLVGAAPASAAEKGVETDMTWGTNGPTRDQTAAGVKSIGAKWMRVTMTWHDIETQKGQYQNLARYDDAFSRAQASGAKIIVTVYTAPNWASGTNERESPPLNPADYANFIRFAATRWGQYVDAWEIWNEQNLTRFWSTGPDARAYARLLKAAYPAVKAVDPSALVVFGGTAYNDYKFLSQAYQEVPNLGDYFDVMGTHPYPRPANRAPENVWYEYDGTGRIAVKAFAGYREVRRVLLGHGDDKPIWFTEFGWATTTESGWGVSPATQASYLTRAYQCVEQDPYVQVAIWYIYRNHAWADDADNWGDQLGLLYSDFSPKPAYNAFKNYTPGNTGCEYQYPQATPPADPEPEPTEEPTDPTTEPAPTGEEQPEGEIQSSSVTRRVNIELLRLADARASRDSNRRRPARSRVRIMGQVSRANRGHVELRLTCRGRGDSDWRRNVTRNDDLNRSGEYNRRFRPRRNSSCTARAHYHAFGQQLGHSRVLRFKT